MPHARQNSVVGQQGPTSDVDSTPRSRLGGVLRRSRADFGMSSALQLFYKMKAMLEAGFQRRVKWSQTQRRDVFAAGISARSVEARAQQSSRRDNGSDKGGQ